MTLRFGHLAAILGFKTCPIFISTGNQTVKVYLCVYASVYDPFDIPNACTVPVCTVPVCVCAWHLTVCGHILAMLCVYGVGVLVSQSSSIQ